MRAKWHKRELRLSLAFIFGLLFGGSVQPNSINQNQPSNISALSPNEIRLIIEEGRRQLDSQVGRLEHVQSRSQLLLTINFVALGFVAGGFRRLNRLEGSVLKIAVGLSSVGIVATLVGLILAAAAIAVGANFSQIDTTKLTTYGSPLDLALARVYANAVIIGETTIAARVTVFRLATRWTCWGAVAMAVVYILSQ